MSSSSGKATTAERCVGGGRRAGARRRLPLWATLLSPRACAGMSLFPPSLCPCPLLIFPTLFSPPFPSLCEVCVCIPLVSLCLSPSPSLSPPRPQVGRTFDPATAFVVDDLKPNTEYAFRLAARSPQGLGAFTSVVRQRTLQSSRCLADPALNCGGGHLAGACAQTRAGPAQGWGAPPPVPLRSSAWACLRPRCASVPPPVQ